MAKHTYYVTSLMVWLSVVCLYGRAKGNIYLVNVPQDETCSEPPYLSMASSLLPEVSVTICSPLDLDFIPIDTIVGSREWHTVYLPMDTRQSSAYEIRASGPIDVHLSLDDKCGGDSTTILPVTDLDNYYSLYGPLNGTAAKTIFGITALDNVSYVSILLDKYQHEIQLFVRDDHVPVGVSYNFTLKPFHTLWFDSFDDLSGLQISASDPVAVFEHIIYPCSRDHLENNDVLENSLTMLCSSSSFEQLLPVSHWGTQFSTLPFSQSGDTLKLQASDEGTNVSLTKRSSTSTINISIGSGQEIHLPAGNVIWIQSNKPLMILQYSQEGCSDLQHGASMNLCPRFIALPSIASARTQSYPQCDGAKKDISNSLNVIVKSTEASELLVNNVSLLSNNDSDLNVSFYGEYGDYSLYRVVLATINGALILHSTPGIHFLITAPKMSICNVQPHTSVSDQEDFPITQEMIISHSVAVTTHLTPSTHNTKTVKDELIFKLKNSKPRILGVAKNILKYKTKATEETINKNSPSAAKETGIQFMVKESKHNDVINLHQAAPETGWTSDGSEGLDMTVIALIISLASAVVLVIVCVAGFLMAEYVCRRDLFSSARVTPYIEFNME